MILITLVPDQEMTHILPVQGQETTVFDDQSLLIDRDHVIVEDPYLLMPPDPETNLIALGRTIGLIPMKMPIGHTLIPIWIRMIH